MVFCNFLIKVFKMEGPIRFSRGKDLELGRMGRAGLYSDLLTSRFALPGSSLRPWSFC